MPNYILKDILGKDELLSTVYTGSEPSEGSKGDLIFEGEGEFITKSGDENFDIGANPSAEEAEEGLDTNGPSQVINVVDKLGLNKMDGIFPTKKDFAMFYKTYWENMGKALAAKGWSDEDVKIWQDDVKAWVIKKGKNFKQLEFYTGSDMNMDGHLYLRALLTELSRMVILEWKNNKAGEEAPFFSVIAAGVEKLKL